MSSRALDEILRDGLIRSVFQPIVDLETGALFGYEALARGPEHSPLELPEQLFEAARRHGRLAELDEVCQRAALAGARAHAIEAPLTLFVDAEPDAMGFGPRAADGARRARRRRAHRANPDEPTRRAAAGRTTRAGRRLGDRHL